MLGGDLERSDSIGRVISGRRHVSPPPSAAVYCGTRGQSAALRGFDLALSAAARLHYTLRYRGWFADGSVAGPFGDGELCLGEHDEPLQAIEVIFSPKIA